MLTAYDQLCMKLFVLQRSGVNVKSEVQCIGIIQCNMIADFTSLKHNNNGQHATDQSNQGMA